VILIWVCYFEGPLFRKSTIFTNSKANPNLNPNFSSNVSTVARICTMNFRNSGPSEKWTFGIGGRYQWPLGYTQRRTGAVKGETMPLQKQQQDYGLKHW